MRPTISQQLLLAPFLCLFMFALSVAITYFGEERLTSLSASSRNLEQQRMDLQMLFRGINESLLTDGTPDSIVIAEASMAAFDERHRQLLNSVTDPQLLAALETEIGPQWQALRQATPPFLQINAVSSEDNTLMARYGRLLVDGENLMARLEELAQHGESLARSGARQVTQLMVGSVVFSLLGIAWLFLHLYRAIAVPLKDLRTSMLAVSDGKGALLERIDHHRQDLPDLDNQDLRQEMTALRHAFQFMLTGVREHLVLRQEAEQALNQLNQELERRVAARTDELLAANQRMKAEIAQREQTQQALETARRDTARILEAAGEGIYGIDIEGRISFVNSAAARMLGREPAEMFGQDAHELFHHTHKDGRPCTAEDCQILAVLQHGKRMEIDSEVFWHRNGTGFPVEYVATPVEDEGRLLGVVVVFRDVSEKKRSEEHIFRLAHYDVLTNLPNRTLFKTQLEQAMVQTRRRHRGLAVLFLDLDRFKYINDTLGHQTGDELLAVISRRIIDSLRPDDIVSRIGGDEFTILLRDVLGNEDVTRVAEQLLRVIAEPIHLEGHQLSVSTSIGISLYPQDGSDVITLQRNADIAMYHAKAQGKGTYCFFTTLMSRNNRERMELESALRQSMEDDDFELAYQPQVCLRDGTVIGVEALLRWNHPGNKPIGPDRFIPVAEDSGLIIPLGEWVLHTACERFRQWMDKGLAPSRIGVNLSARQFCDSQLKNKVRDALKTYDLNPACLELELTESSVMNNPEASISILRELKSMGVQIAVDDFGIAYSSLGYLKRLPIDRLKIDRSFIRDIPNDTDDAAITTTIIDMAHNLGLKVIAEGVETEEQLAFLCDKDCDEIQGYLFSRPLNVRDIGELLGEGRRLEPQHGRAGHPGRETRAGVLVAEEQD